MPNYTLTYSDSSGNGQGGWPSFYSYFPEQIQGMNQYLYTFDKGNLYRHNTNPTRNQYYDEALVSITPSSVTTTIIGNPLESKVFKTIELESDLAWTASLESDIQSARTVNSTWFEKKEGNWFAFVRGLTASGATNFSMRSANGLGVVTTVNPAIPAATTLTFPTGFQVGSIASIGDFVYSTSDPATVAPVLAGQIVAPLSSTSNVLTIDTVRFLTQRFHLNSDFILYQKNQIAESHGLLGHYCQITLSNDSTAATELYAVVSDVMKSYP
jgi:hypothetical protein